MLLPSVQIGSPPVESPASDGPETTHPRDVRLEVSRGDEQGALQSRADGGDKLFADVGDTHIGLRQRIDACISAPEVELDSVRGRVCLGGHDRVRIAVEPDDWSKAQFRRRDREHP